MSSQSRLFAFLCLLLCFGAACRPSIFPEDFRTMPEEAGALLFQDSFEDPTSQWDRVRQAEGMTDYDGGKYRIYVNDSNADYWANPGLHFTDVRIEVDAKRIGGPDNNNFGILCRYQDMRNFYFFIISSDGYYGIGKVENGRQTLIEPDQMYPSKFIHQGSEINHILALCDGSRLTLAVNGEFVAETEDNTFWEGDVGLIAGSFEEPGVDIIFDNFVVFRP